jgi:hypothetical protein
VITPDFSTRRFLHLTRTYPDFGRFKVEKQQRTHYIEGHGLPQSVAKLHAMSISWMAYALRKVVESATWLDPANRLADRFRIRNMVTISQIERRQIAP